MNTVLAGCMFFMSSCAGEAEKNEPVEEVEFSLNFDLIHQIEEFPHPDQPYYFPEITAVRSYGEEDFLLTDNWLKQILHINENGELVKLIGREGKGPGEFTNLHTVIPMRDGKIAVSNRGDARTIIFNSDGELVQQHLMQPEDPYLFGKVYPAGEDTYITADHNGRSEFADCIFVELDAELRTNERCLGSYDDLNESEIPFLRLSGVRPFGDIHFLDNDRFMFVRGSYDGTHYIYQRKGGDWEIQRKVTGYTQIPASVSDLPDTPSNREKGNWVKIKYHGYPEMFVIRHNQSMGYQVYDDKYLLHFTTTDQDGEYVPGVELFSRNGDYHGYQDLSDLKDKHGFKDYMFYRSAYNNGQMLIATKFALYVFELSLNILQ